MNYRATTMGSSNGSVAMTVPRIGRRLAGKGSRFLLRRSPFEVYRRRPGYHYVPDYYGRSAHKDLDIRTFPIFGELAARAVADGRTLLYYDKLYTVFQAIHNLARRPGGTAEITIADVGAFRGGAGHFMASCAEALGIEQVKLHCFDTFGGQPEEDVRPDLEPTQEAGRKQGRYEDVSANEVREYLAPFPGGVVHAGRFQDTAVNVEDESFDFAHVDVNLYEPTAFALSFFGERLAEHGIMVVDDFGSFSNPGVDKAVDEFLESRTDFVRFHQLTGQCVLLKRCARAVAD